MSALGHCIEEEVVATAAISLIRLHTEKVRPPRALWVPYELGRPFGPPSDVGFQRRVVLAALRLLTRDNGPAMIEDYPDDDPRSQPDPDWRPPLARVSVTNTPGEEIAAQLANEVARLWPAHEAWRLRAVARRSV